MMDTSPNRYSPSSALPSTRLFGSFVAARSTARTASVSTPQRASMLLARTRASGSRITCSTHWALLLVLPTRSAAFERSRPSGSRSTWMRIGRMRAPSVMAARISRILCAAATSDGPRPGPLISAEMRRASLMSSNGSISTTERAMAISSSRLSRAGLHSGRRPFPPSSSFRNRPEAVFPFPARKGAAALQNSSGLSFRRLRNTFRAREGSSSKRSICSLRRSRKTSRPADADTEVHPQIHRQKWGNL
jgi:hypothetical protein